MSKAKVVIKRNKWRCGGYGGDTRIGEGSTMLINKEGFMCCLGFAAKQLGGLTDEDIKCQTAPDFREIPHLSKLRKTGIGGLVFDMSELAGNALAINDSRDTSVKREGLLTDLFDKHGVELKFVNKYRRKDRKK